MNKGKIVTICEPFTLFTDDALLIEYGIHRPFIIEFVNACNKQDIKLGKVINLEEVIDSICLLK